MKKENRQRGKNEAIIMVYYDNTSNGIIHTYLIKRTVLIS